MVVYTTSNMDSENLMQAVIHSFLDANLQVELLPSLQQNVSTGSGPARAHHEASAQAVDDQYATVYKVHHCKVIPTSPPLTTTEFPPQRADVYPGRDHFQVGGMGSGESGSVPTKSTCYRGGLTWSSKDAVHTPRVSLCSDPFASSLRKYPHLSPERSAELFEKLINYSPRKCQSPQRSTQSAHRQASPVFRQRSPRAYEEAYAARCWPRAPEESPTRDRRQDSLRNQIATKYGDLRLYRGESRRHRESLKSSYTHTQAATACTVANDVTRWYDTTIQETSETEYDTNEFRSASEMGSYPVSRTVQAVPRTTSREVETAPQPTPTKRTIAIPLSPTPSLPGLDVQVNGSTYPLISKSVQALHSPGRSVETTTSSVEFIKHDSVNVIAKKSKSLSDFRLNRDFKSEILEWLDDISDPRIKEIQEIVLKNLASRLKGKVPECEKIKVMIGDCVKSHIKRGYRSSNDVSKKYGHRSNRLNKDVFRAEVNSRLGTDQNNFEDVIKEWLNHISFKKRDVFLRPVKKDQIFNTFVNRLKHLVVKHSEPSREQSLRTEIMEILDEIPIEVNTCDKKNYLGRLTDDLMKRLQNISGGPGKCRFDVPERLSILQSHYQPTEKEAKDFVRKKITGVLEKQNILNSALIKEMMVDLEDILMDSVNSNLGLEEIARLLQCATKFSKTEAYECALQLIEHWREILNKKYTNITRMHPLTVFMVPNVLRNCVPTTLDAKMSQHSIGSIVDNDICVNVYQYKIQLAKQIGQWLSDLAIPQTRDKKIREAAFLNLAGDIVDRQKYLEFNKNSHTDVDELEHLKYQIFKWTKRLVGEENMETVDHAAELMEMIKNIPVPMLTKSQDQLSQSNSHESRQDGEPEPSHSMNICCDNVRSKSNSGLYKKGKSQDGSVLTNFVVHKVSTNMLNGSKKQSKQRDQSPSASKQTRHTTGNQSGTSVHNKSDASVCRAKNKCIAKERDIQKNTDPSGNTNNPGHSNQDHTGLAVPSSTEKAPSATSKLMADWRPPPTFTSTSPGAPLLEKVHEEYQDYLKNWAQQIPIPCTTPDEIKIAEKARLGILKGIWKMMTKIKTQPAVFHNKFYYEDVLGKEIDDLLDCLPQTQELKDNRHILKAQLLEKTSYMNELVKDLEMPDNYKEIIAQNIEKKAESVRNAVKVDSENPTKMFEQMLMYCILDDFLMEMNYKENDKIKATAYKMKLLRRIQTYIDELKTTHGKEVEDIFSEMNQNEIMRVLSNVSLPSDESVNKDAEEIFLASEIEQWMINLPIVENNDITEQRHRRRLRDALTKKLFDLEKANRNIASCCGETEVKQEISFFLNKLPLQEDKDLKINEMVDELANKLKNRHGTRERRNAKVFQNGCHLTNTATVKHTSNEWAVEEDEEAQYKAFFQNQPLCSTRIDLPGDEWGMENDQYRGFFTDRPACSTMNEPQARYGIDANGPGLPDDPYECDPYSYSPDQFHESSRCVSNAYPRRVSFSQSHRYPEPGRTSMAPCGPQKFYDMQGNLIPILSGGQYRPLTHDESEAFVTMEEHFPDMNVSRQRVSNGRPKNWYRSQMDPNIPENAMPAANASRFSRLSNASRPSMVGVDRMRPKPHEVSIHDGPLATSLHRSQDPAILQQHGEADDGGHEAVQDAQNRSIRNTSTRQSTQTKKLTSDAASKAPESTPQRFEHGLPSSTPFSEISNNPVGFSTPNQRISNTAPPNIREQRQMQRVSARRRVMDHDEGEERCRCTERFKQWTSRRGAPNCSTCDDCLQAGTPPFYPYPYPFLYPYPPHYRPPYPPYCRR